MKIGIDAGGTLIKIVQEHDNRRYYRTELTTNIQKVIDWLNNEEIETLSKGHSLHNKSKLLPLNPFVDSKRVLRVGGRLGNSN